MAKEKNLSSLFEEISIKWISYVEHCKSKIKKNTYNIDSSHEFHDLFIIQFKQKIESLVDKKKFIVKSSVGEGNLAGIPWLCVMDLSITGKSTEGFYIVYLFSQDAKKVFLSIGIGAGQFIDVYGDNKLAINKIENAKNFFQKIFNDYAPDVKISDINLLNNQDKNPIRPFTSKMISRLNSYEAGSFFSKEYSIDDKIPEEVYLNDFNKYLGVYQQIADDPKSSALIDILAETVHEQNDSEGNKDFDYEIPVFNPTSLEDKKSSTSKSKINLNKNLKPTKSSKKVGDAGEKYVYDYECSKLKKIGRIDLIDKIVKQYEDYSYFPGYDIKSFDEKGNEIFIEVKSTAGKKSKQNFEITYNEWNAAKLHQDKYFIYMVHNALVNPKISFKIKNPSKYELNDMIAIEPLVYKVSFNSE